MDIHHCKKCKQTVKSRQYHTIGGSPETLFIHFKTIEDDGKIVDMNEPAFPHEFDLQDFFNEEDKQLQKSRKYKLSTVIKVSGEDIEHSEYSVYSKRTGPDHPKKRRWYHFTKTSYEEVSLETVLSSKRPQIVIYEK